MLTDRIPSSPDPDLLSTGLEAPGGLEATAPPGPEASSLEPQGSAAQGPVEHQAGGPDDASLDPGAAGSHQSGYAADGAQEAGAAASTLALRKELHRVQQAVAQDTDRAAELQSALDALAALKGVGDNIWLDQRMTPEELRRVASWGDDQAQAREGARFLLAHPEYLDGAANPAGDLTGWRIDQALAALRGQKREAEQTLSTDQGRLADVQLELGLDPAVPAPAQPAGFLPKGPTAAGGATGAGAPAPGSTEALLARPLSLDMGSVQGGDPLTSATDRLTNAMGGLETQIDQVVAQLGQETDPGKRSALEARLNQLNRAMTEVTNMLQQLTTMMQNIAKLFNDIAMNAIRHIA